MRSRTLSAPALAVVLATAGLALPGAALARGGGGTTTPPPPTTTPSVLCDYAIDGTQPDGSTLFSNQAGDAGCVTVRMSGSTLRLYRVALTPGWTYTVTSNGEGTNSRVALQFNQAATGRRVDVKIEFGKTDIRG